MTEFNRYVTATQTFRDKYFSLPGDMSNATSFWGKDNAKCSGDTGAVSTPGTCNGNGDGLIDPAAIALGTGERFQFWKQLQLAGLIEGKYTGYASGSTYGCVVGTTCPKSRVGNAGWYAEDFSAYNAGSANVYAVTYGNVLSYGTQTAAEPENPALTPSELWNIDTKIDDGKPARGKIIARFWNNLCSAADDGTHSQTDLAASYKLTDNSVQCAFYVRDFL